MNFSSGGFEDGPALRLKVHENQFRTRLVPSDTENKETREFATGLAEFVAGGNK
ncbi:hypothetical protein GF420_01775 [candidate division GN15 bacterium]|nr:hypothetical protein [candidate division GN15 bacterium]